MKMKESLRVCVLKKYADFNGTASRSEYWWFWGIYMLISIGLPILAFILGDLVPILDRTVGLLSILWIIGSLGLLIPFIAVSVRRLHDSRLSGGHFLWILIPYIGYIIVCCLMLRKHRD